MPPAQFTTASAPRTPDRRARTTSGAAAGVIPTDAPFVTAACMLFHPSGKVEWALAGHDDRDEAAGGLTGGATIAARYQALPERQADKAAIGVSGRGGSPACLLSLTARGSGAGDDLLATQKVVGSNPISR